MSQQLTDEERESLAELLLSSNITALQCVALGKIIQAKLLVHDEMSAKLANAAINVVEAARALDSVDVQLSGAWQALTNDQREQLKGTKVERTALHIIEREARVEIPECDCGRTSEPWHPKRGKCKQSLGGVKL